MFAFDSAESVSELMDELERFVSFWVGQKLSAGQATAAVDTSLPHALDRLLAMAEAWPDNLFGQVHRLHARDELVRDGERLYFLDIEQTGPAVYALIGEDPDPPVYCADEPGAQGEQVGPLSEYLVSFALQNLMYWATDEAWDLDFPAICRRHGLPVEAIWTNRPCVWPGNIQNYYLCAGQVLTVEQPSADVRFQSSAHALDNELRAAIRADYPRWS